MYIAYLFEDNFQAIFYKNLNKSMEKGVVRSDLKDRDKVYFELKGLYKAFFSP